MKRRPTVSICKRKDSGDNYFYTFRINGKTFKGSCKTPDKEEAREIGEKELGAVLRTLTADGVALYKEPIDDVFLRHENNLIALGRSEATLRHHQEYQLRFFEHFSRATRLECLLRLGSMSRHF